MQAYGRRMHDELEYPCLGAPSKHLLTKAFLNEVVRA